MSQTIYVDCYHSVRKFGGAVVGSGVNVAVTYVAPHAFVAPRLDKLRPASCANA